MRPRPDRALKRAVADLARLHPDDVEAILGALDADERSRLDRIVAGSPETREPERAAEEPAWIYEGISPWLRDRLEPEGKGGTFALVTPASVQALRAAAEPFRKLVEGKERRGPTLLARAIALLAGARS